MLAKVPPRPLVCTALIALLAACTQTPAADPTLRALQAGVTLDRTGAMPATDRATLRAMARLRPDDAAVQAAQARAALAADDLTEAATAIDRAIAIGPATADWLTLQGRIALLQGNAEKAAPAFAAANAAAPGRIETLTGYGVALGSLGRAAEAVVPLREAQARDPQNWMARGNLAFSLVNANEAPAAVALLAAAETDTRVPVRVRHNLALALVAAGQRDRALRVLRLEMGPVEAMQLANGFAEYATAMQPFAGAAPEPAPAVLAAAAPPPPPPAATRRRPGGRAAAAPDVSPDPLGLPLAGMVRRDQVEAPPVAGTPDGPVAQTPVVLAPIAAAPIAEAPIAVAETPVTQPSMALESVAPGMVRLDRVALAPPPVRATPAAPPPAGDGLCAPIQVTLRSGSHPGFGRVVFEWRVAPAHQIAESPDGLSLRFPGAGCRPAVAGLAVPRNVLGITEAQDGEAIRIATAPGSRIRYFWLGGRLVIDVLDPPGTG